VRLPTLLLVALLGCAAAESTDEQSQPVAADGGAGGEPYGFDHIEPPCLDLNDWRCVCPNLRARCTCVERGATNGVCWVGSDLCDGGCPHCLAYDPPTCEAD
jgi:hypothetical protein